MQINWILMQTAIIRKNTKICFNDFGQREELNYLYRQS